MHRAICNASSDRCFNARGIIIRSPNVQNLDQKPHAKKEPAKKTNKTEGEMKDQNIQKSRKMKYVTQWVIFS